MNAVVLGGTFAPPTLAHGMLMNAALEHTHADRGVWTPASISYMRAWRNGDEREFADNDFRERMLRAMTANDERMEICARELRLEGAAYTYDTLISLATRFEKLWFVIGSDNLKLLPGWHNAEALVSEFLWLVCERKNDDARGIITESPLLNAHAGNIEILTPPDDMRDVSASHVRALITGGRASEARKYLNPAVYTEIINHFAPRARNA